MKALRRYEPGTLNRHDLVDLTENLKRKSATTIFRKIGVKRYARHGSSYAVPGLAAIQGLPKRAPVRLIDDERWYSPEELLDVWVEWASDKELEKITK
jgi:hypothetical protein